MATLMVNTNAIVYYKTRREAAISSGSRKSVIDTGTDKPVGSRWGVLKNISVPKRLLNLIMESNHDL